MNETTKNIRCLMDMSIPEDNKCASCCIYCDEKSTCKQKCSNIDKWTTEEEIEKNCDESI